MSRNRGYRVVPFSGPRRVVAASAAVAHERNTVHGLFEVDVTEARRLLREHRERTGEALSFTAFVVAAVGRAIAEDPNLNAVRRGRKAFLLDDVTVATLVERTVGGGTVPEQVPIHHADTKSLRQIHDEIRAAQQRPGGAGAGTANRLTRFVPDFLIRAAVRAAIRNVARSQQSGVVTVTAVGMYGRGPGWGIPLSLWTVALTVGGLAPRPVVRDDRLETREHLCLTASFDHDIVDGAPAVRFMSRLAALLRSGDLVREALAGEVGTIGSAGCSPGGGADPPPAGPASPPAVE
jgi:pyruvate/2-oxoglutarate dehydrogenase complex dihydrolipoamide acyltransferase (E2) component